MGSNTGKAGVIVAPDDANSMDKLAHTVVDDLLYNVVQDLLIKVHRDEKMARATTAVIRAEKLASDASESSTPDSKPDVRIETDAAIYEDGKVILKGNPLKTTKDILCPRCHLPRLLHPTDGKGARKPDPSVIYCKKHPYIEKPGFDIYGQTWVQPGPGRGKKKKDMKPDPNLEIDPNNPDQRPPNVLSFPSATCSKCKRCILVTRLNNHMGSCIGNSGRNASRAAAAKISNGNNSQNDPTPPGSQKATPAPGSRASSPKKRDSDELTGAGADEEEGGGSETSGPKKKKLKPSPLTKKVIIKTKGPGKDKVKGNSGLSVEQKIDDDDEDAPADSSTVEVVPPPPTTTITKKKSSVAASADKENGKGPSPVKKVKPGQAKPPLSSPMSKNGRDGDGESESSGTLSSPPRH